MAKRPQDRFESASAALTALEAPGRISVPHQRRELRQRILGASLALIALVGGAVLLAQALLGPPISEVKVDAIGPDMMKTPAILARYGRRTEWEVFHKFSPEAGYAVGAALAHISNGTQIVVAGIEEPWEGPCLYAFDARGKAFWQKDMSNGRHWPDCNEPTKWRCRAVAAGQLDAVPGEDIVALASDRNEYPTRVSIVDPGTGDIRSSFWHLGQISGIRVVENFFAVGHPAIVAWGQNNKLDGFGREPARPYVPSVGEDIPQTEYNIVACVVILDPWALDGSGPPRVPQLPDLPPKPPYAYAFLDMPRSTQADYVPGGSTGRRTPEVA